MVGDQVAWNMLFDSSRLCWVCPYTKEGEHTCLHRSDALETPFDVVLVTTRPAPNSDINVNYNSFTPDTEFGDKTVHVHIKDICIAYKDARATLCTEQWNVVGLHTKNAARRAGQGMNTKSAARRPEKLGG